MTTLQLITELQILCLKNPDAQQMHVWNNGRKISTVEVKALRESPVSEEDYGVVLK